MIQLLPFFFQLLPPSFLYAETHYRFRYFFSFLRKREPEIIADAPHRIEPNLPLPILILLKDAHLFPTTLVEITAVIRLHGEIIQKYKLLESSLEISEKLWWRIFPIPLDGITGKIECDVLFKINNGKKTRLYRNDNHRTSSHGPLKVFVAPSSLPRFEHLHFGECHSHSSYTDDQVEFGSPLEASSLVCRSIGLSFFCVTDHSYDLDDTLDNYLVNDPELSKWRLLQQEVDALNSNLQNFVVVRGEEVTCRNSENQNIHLLLLGNRKFYYGSGDGAEQWLKTKSENSIYDVLKDIEPCTLSFAAHPKEPVSFLQRVLLHRGTWSKRDFAHPHLSGIQFVNGKLSSCFLEGYRQWKESLQQGKRIFALAGNDAHGNFNRFRQIGVPFLKIQETEHQLFGKMRTGVFLKSLSEKNLLQAIHSGKTIITDGPAANLLIDSSKNQISSIGQNFTGKKHTVTLEVRSSNEFGSIYSFKVFIGKIGQEETIVISEKPFQTYHTIHKFTIEIGKESYLRAEVWTASADSIDGQPHFCLTNPIWFKPI